MSVLPHNTHTSGLIFHTVHLDRLGSLPEETVRFYMAELSSAVCFLHEKRIMHRYAVPSVIFVFHLFWCLFRHSTETSSRITFSLMSTVMLTLPTLILPSISLSGAYSLAWLDPWPIWLLKFFTSAATLTPLIGGHSVFVHMNFFLGADRSEVARIPLSHKAFPKTRCDFLRT